MPYMNGSQNTDHKADYDVNQNADQNKEEPKKLILCFDGTGNTFSGSSGDTNVAKILRKLDRNHPNQYHYYQTGIGTYDVNETSINKTVFGELKSNLLQTVDQGFGTTFDAHVVAGYRFLMRYYETGAKIYIFGFSRGAFTARFLARMIHTVGLLCKGNEEMVSFAYRLYQRYLQGEIKDREKPKTTADGDQKPVSTINFVATEETREAKNEIEAFSQTFCRKEGDSDEEAQNIKVFFLGIWDCVASVAVLERKAPIPVPVIGTAHHVRHAVSVDERRVKFKPALLAQDIRNVVNDESIPQAEEDIVEVWFPGDHSDVGGGWPAIDPRKLRNPPSWFQRLKLLFRTFKPNKPSENVDYDRFQMSDIPLEWMIREVKKCGKMEKGAKVHWCHSVKTFKEQMNDPERRPEAIHGFRHDCLSPRRGASFFKVLMWNLMEWLPFISRWELHAASDEDKYNGWRIRTLIPNKGSARDIPPGAVLHQSLIDRLRIYENTYKPKNNHGDHSDQCLPTGKKVIIYDRDDEHPAKETAQFRIHQRVVFNETKKNKGGVLKKRVRKEQVKEDDPRHQTYDFYSRPH